MSPMEASAAAAKAAAAAGRDVRNAGGQKNATYRLYLFHSLRQCVLRHLGEDRVIDKSKFVGVLKLMEQGEVGSNRR
jgi:hypothetical protein